MVKRSRSQDVPKAAGAGNSVQAPQAPEPMPVRNYAPKGIAAVLAPVLRPAFKRRAPASAQLLADWEPLAGPDLALLAAPVKFAGGTLTLACSGPAALSLQHRVPQIIQRLNLGLGSATVERIRFVHAESRPEAGPVPAPKQVGPAVQPRADLPEGKLGEALARLYSSLMTKP